VPFGAAVQSEGACDGPSGQAQLLERTGVREGAQAAEDREDEPAEEQAMTTRARATEQAVRLADITDPHDVPGDLDDARVCYWKAGRGWWIYLPRAGAARLENHRVIEHNDQTITVSPSIGMRTTGHGAYARHGFLERGVWREV